MSSARHILNRVDDILSLPVLGAKTLDYSIEGRVGTTTDKFEFASAGELVTALKSFRRAAKYDRITVFCRGEQTVCEVRVDGSYVPAWTLEA